MAETKYSEIKIVRVGEASTEDGRKFPTYKTVIKGNKTMDVKFVRTCKNVPTEPCIVRVEDGKWNIDRSRFYPVCWIKDVLEKVPLPIKEQENPFI